MLQCAGWASAEGVGPSAARGSLGRAGGWDGAEGKEEEVGPGRAGVRKKKAGPCELLGPRGKKEEGAGWAE